MIGILFDSYIKGLIVIILLTIILFLVVFAIIELISIKRESDINIEEKKLKNNIKKFYHCLDIVNEQSTGEVLECLIEMERLDNIYDEIIDSNYEIMDDVSYLKLKSDILNKIIKNKIDLCNQSKNKLKSLLSEIEICRNRYPIYNAIFVENNNLIKKKLKNKESIIGVVR